MTQEENAKVYTELINRLEDVKNAIKKQNYGIAMDILCKPYPEFQITTSTELKESEESDDERMIKSMTRLVKAFYDCNFPTPEGFERKDMLTWLEKQGEQKPVVIIPKFRVGDTIRIKNSDAEYTITEISDGYYRGKGWCLDIAAGDECGDYELVDQKPGNEEDEAMLNVLIQKFEGEHVYVSPHLAAECLKSLKDRVHPRPKQEWSEEDEGYYNSIIEHLKYSITNGKPETYISGRLTDWLKSLKERYTWKPSKEQIMALRWVLNHIPYDSHKEEISGLLDQIKDL